MEVCLSENSLSRRMSRVMEKRIDSLITTEVQAITQMKRYRDKASTASNYRKAVHAHKCLNKAVDALVEDDAETALEQLRKVDLQLELTEAKTARKRRAA